MIFIVKVCDTHSFSKLFSVDVMVFQHIRTKVGSNVFGYVRVHCGFLIKQDPLLGSS